LLQRSARRTEPEAVSVGVPPARPPSDLADLVEWWLAREEGEHDLGVERRAREHQPIEHWPASSPARADDRPPAAGSEATAIGSLVPFRDALEQVLLDEALADGLVVP
jgi:hypothetical protein